MPEPEFPVTFDFLTEQKCIDTLLSDWEEEKTKVRDRRELRENKKNVAEEQQLGTILLDETIIPDRTINTNIHRGRVAYINYITQSKRLLIIEDVDDANVFTEPMELWFTRGFRFPGWKIPWFKLIDAMHTHGGAAIEIVYNDDKPLKFDVEYIPRDSLIFNRKTRNIQASPRLLRQYEISVLELDEFKIKYKFNEAAVREIMNQHKTNDDLVVIHKMLFRRDGIVYNAWYSKESKTLWLRDPMIHNVGLFDYNKDLIISLMEKGSWKFDRESLQTPMSLKQYPVFWFPYDVTENETILEIQGRVALDLHEQEALTHLMTNAVNASTRASNLYPVADGEPGADPKLLELGPLKHGSILTGTGAKLFQPPWPNNIILAITQVLDQRKAQQTGSVDFAALARKDANKTATEMNLATQQSQSLNTTELDIFSSPFLDVLALCFKIACHQAIFLLCKPPPDFQQLFGDYHLSPAGDVEVVKRLEDRERAKEFFNIVKGTPLAEKLFSFLIQKFFPDEAADWIKVLETPNRDDIIRQLVNVLQSVPTDELTPEQRTALRAIIISAQNVVGPGDNSEVPAISEPPQVEPIGVSNATQQTITA